MNLPNIPQPVADFGQKALNVLKTPITNITGGIKDYSAIKGQLKDPSAWFNNPIPQGVMAVPSGPNKAALTGALGEARGRVIGGALQIGIPAAAAGMMLRNKLKRRREAAAGDNSMNKMASVILWGLQKTAAPSPGFELHPSAVSSANSNIDHATRIKLYRESLQEHAASAVPGRLAAMGIPALGLGAIGALSGFGAVGNRTGALVGGGLGAATGALIGNMNRNSSIRNKNNAAATLAAAENDPELLRAHIAQMQAARDDYSADMAMLRDDMKEDRRLQTARDVGMAFANRPSASGPVVNNNIYR